MKVYYDEEGDFLEISVGKPTKSYAEEVRDGVFIRKDEVTDEIKSIGILSFKKRAKSLHDIEVDVPVEITFPSR